MTVQTLGGAGQDRRLAGRWFVPLIPIAIAVFCLSALAYYRIWQDGAGQPSGLPQQLVVVLYEGIGFVPAFMFFLLVLAWSSIWFLTGELDRPGGRLGRLVGLMLALAILVNLRPELAVQAPHGGALGNYLAMRLQSVFGYTISTLLVAPVALCALLLATDFFFYRYFEGMGRPAPKGRGARRQLVTEAGVESVVTDHFKGLAGTATLPEAGKTLSWEDLPEVDLEGALPDEPYDEPEDAGRESADGAAGGSAEPAAARVEELEDSGRADVSWSRRAERRAREQVEAEPLAEDSATDRALEEARSETIEVGPPDEPGGAPDLQDLGLVEDDEDTPGYEAEEFDEEDEDGEDLLAFGDEDERAAEEEEYEDDEEEEEDPDDEVEYEEEEAYDEDDEDDEAEDDADADDGEYEAYDDDEEEDDVEPLLSYEGELDDLQLEDEAGGEDVDEDVEVAPAKDVESTDEEVEEGGKESLEDRAERAALPDEPVVPIPRPTPGARQGKLFSQGLDPEVLTEARELVKSTGRASASHLQRRLRIDFDQAMELLDSLACEGLIEIEEGATSGRVIH